MRFRFLACAFAVVASFLLLDLVLPILPYGVNLHNVSLQPRTADGWIRELQSANDPTRRARAADALWQFGEPIVANVIPCLHHPAKEVRCSAYVALTRMGPSARAATSHLIELVQRPTEPARLQAIEALASIGAGPVAVIDPLVAAAQDQDATIRKAAIIALGRNGAQAEPALVSLLHHGDAETRRWVVESLAKTGTQSAAVCEAIVPLVEDVALRWAVFVTLAAHGEAAVKPLTRLLKHPQPQIRAHAATALCRIGSASQSAAECLLVALTDDNANVRFWALRTLAELELDTTGQQQIMVTLNDPDADVRWQAKLTTRPGSMKQKGTEKTH